LTKAKPGAFDTCRCGKRKRSVSVQCSACSTRDYEKLRWQRAKRAKHEAIARREHEARIVDGIDASLVAELVQQDAEANGHVIVMDRDETEEECYVGRCSECERWLSVDLTAEDDNGQSTPVFGRVLEGQCPGQPDAAAVVINLDTIDLPTGGSNEPDQGRTFVDYTAIASYPPLAED
jgi:hypothetical protein